LLASLLYKALAKQYSVLLPPDVVLQLHNVGKEQTAVQHGVRLDTTITTIDVDPTASQP